VLLNYLIAMTALLGMLLLWVSVQAMARRFAERHPHLGPLREEGAGCGSGSCSCGTSCSSPETSDAPDARQGGSSAPRPTLYTIQEPQ